MPARRTQLPECLKGRVFTRSQGIAAGLTRGQFDSGAVRRVMRGIYADPALPFDVFLRIDAALLVTRDLPGFVAGEFAVYCFALPRPLRAQTTIDPLLEAAITMAVDAAGRRCEDRAGLDVAEVELPPEHICHYEGRPLLSPARLFVDLAETWRLEDLVSLADAALHRNLVTLDDLTAVVEWAARRRGVVLARRALDLVNPAAESAMETRLRLLIVLAGLPAPDVNVPVSLPNGRSVRPDLSYRELRIAIEYDGEVHADAVERARDEARRVALRQLGWVVLSFTREEVLRSPSLVIERVGHELAARGWKPAA